MSFAVFILSTGRCGTQWIASQLSQHYGELYHVEHEPLHNAYCPRRMLGCRSPDKMGGEDSASILAHADCIEHHLEKKNYIECGHPCWSTLPYFAGRFRGRLRIVHFVRHPIPTAYSWLTHGAYQPPILPHLQMKELLSPFDAGISFPEYRERWSAMTAFERCLYYWAEVNAFAHRFEARPGAPWLRISFERLFNSDALTQLLWFLKLPPKPELVAAKSSKIDAFHHVTGTRPDFSVIEKHRRVLEIARALGYDPVKLDSDATELYRRYTGFDSAPQ
ncbi:MAG TPA: hypothetical protein VKX17_14215 [Planctomycetota bacterium]|nr:hypothetical protein [Planctomycetota bacterium]